MVSDKRASKYTGLQKEVKLKQNIKKINMFVFLEVTSHIPFLLIFRVALAEDFLESITESNTAVLVGATSNLFSMCLS